MGCDAIHLEIGRGGGYFNPRTRVGCDEKLNQTIETLNEISIHAPGWGATTDRDQVWPRPRNFNPRTRVGCDGRQRQLPPPQPYFNPRTRVGCDHCLQLMTSKQQSFQSTHPGGVRLTRPPHCGRCARFQSTHPGGVRLRARKIRTTFVNFNPRTRVGCD